MRLRNPETGTVIEVGDETGKRLKSAGWKAAESGRTSAAAAEPAEPSDDEGAEAAPKPRRRTTSK